MCGRYVLDDPKDLYDRFQIEAELDAIELVPNYNTAPTQIMPVIVEDKEGKRKMEQMKWGLIPSWANDPKMGFKMINARAETLDEKPSWKTLLKHRRCLVPATGFYEWKRDGATKIPHYFHLKSKEMFAFAGLHSSWSSPDTGEIINTYNIITTSPNKIMEGIHDRMPVMLKKENEAFWVDSDVDDSASLLQLLIPYSDEEMEEHIVSTTVNSVKSTSPDLLNSL